MAPTTVSTVLRFANRRKASHPLWRGHPPTLQQAEPEARPAEPGGIVLGSRGLERVQLRSFQGALIPVSRCGQTGLRTGARGQLRLAAVEWVERGPNSNPPGVSEAPSVLGMPLHILNPAVGFWIMHAWVWEPNPAGMFADWNPEVSCS
jgi:hypothetical protein